MYHKWLVSPIAKQTHFCLKEAIGEQQQQNQLLPNLYSGKYRIVRYRMFMTYRNKEKLLKKVTKNSWLSYRQKRNDIPQTSGWGQNGLILGFRPEKV